MRVLSLQDNLGWREGRRREERMRKGRLEGRKEGRKKREVNGRILRVF